VHGFDDFQRSCNLAADPATYELENDAIARNGLLDLALAELAPWVGRDLLDVGCGTGYWLPRYAHAARLVIGVEPDADLLPKAADRIADVANAEVRPGSAEHMPVEDASADVAHARFAYFFGTGADAGLAEVQRVLRPGGVFAAVDNDWGWGEFATLLKDATTGNAAIDPDETDAWWRARGATRTNVQAGWNANSPQELERILRIEFPSDVVDRFLYRRDPSPNLSYGVAIFTIHT
jgi:SAM-dependent methyltransferase